MVFKTPRIERNLPLHQQIMRRIAPILVLVFVLFSLAGTFLLYNGSTVSIQQQHFQLLTERSREVESLLEQVSADASALAGRAPALAFAEEAVAEVDANPGSATLNQFELQRDFLRLLNERSGQYEQVRFVTVTGSVWTAVSVNNGVLNTDLRLKPAELKNDRVFQNSLNTARVTFSPITLRTDTAGASRIVMVAYAPVADLAMGGQIIGVVELTVSARPLLDRLRTLPGQDYMRWILLNNQGRYLADSNALRLGAVDQNTYQPLADIEPALDALLGEHGSDVPLRFLGGDAVSAVGINAGNVPDMPWSLVLVEPDALGMVGFWGGLLLLALVSGVGIALTVWGINTALRHRLAPLTTARAMAHRLAEGEVEDTLTPPAANADELTMLMDAFKRISLRLHEMSLDLDEQMQRRARVLESALKVTRGVSASDDALGLLRRAVDLIADEFHLYYVQAFVLDDVGLNAVLVYGRGETGQALVEQGYRVLVGSPTVVGYVTRVGEMAYLPDVGIPDDIPYVSHSRLLDTRAELALPLRADNQLLGVLDLHSSRPRAIQADEAQLFQMIADQLAVALLKTRQLAQAEQRAQQTEFTSRQSVRGTWDEAERRHQLTASYRYDLVNVESTTGDGNIAALSAPIVIRGEVVGTIAAAAPEGLPFTEGDHATLKAVADRVALAMEGARLFQETQTGLAVTSTLYNLSRHLNEAEHLRDIIQAVVVTIAPDASGGQIWLFDEYAPGTAPKALELYTDWSFRPRTLAGRLEGTRFQMVDSLFLSALEPSRVQTITDVSRDRRLDDSLRAFFAQLEARSVALVPVSVRGQWRGLLMIEFNQPRDFSESEGRAFSALMDQAGVAIDNRLLFDAAQSEVQRALALAEVGQLATRVSGQFDQAISEVFERVAEPAQYDRWLLVLVDEETPNHLRVVTRHSPEGLETAAEAVFDLETGEHSIMDAVRQNVVLLVNDPASYPAFRYRGGAAIAAVGKHIATPIRVGDRVAGALLVGRGLDRADLDERDEQLVRTLTAQLAVAVDNRRLFRVAEEERAYLRSILETMPTGVVVLDAHTFYPIQANAQAEWLLGKPINLDVRFDVAEYNLIRTGTQALYPMSDLAIFRAANGQVEENDDLSIQYADGTQTDLLLNAAPIRNPRGDIDTIVAAFQDIKTLRTMENTLQNTLRDQIALYETTRTLANAPDVESALDATLMPLVVLEPTDAYIVLTDPVTNVQTVVRALVDLAAFNLPPDVFTPEMVIYPDIEGAALGRGMKAALLAGGVAAVVTVPLRARDTLMGWVALTFDHPVEMTPDNERFLSTLADNAAVALDNRNLFMGTQMAFQEARTLYEISRALANATEPQQVVQAVVTRLNQSHITQVVMAVPASLNPELDSLLVVSHWQREGSQSISLEGLTLNAEQFPAWRLVASPELLTLDDAETDPTMDAIERMGLSSIDARSLAVLPLRAGTRRIGALWLSSDQPYTYTERDHRIYQSFIEQASLSIEAGRLVQQTERRARQLATSAQVSQIASSILDLNELLPQIVVMIRDAFGYDHVQVFLMDAADEYAVLRASTGEAGRQLLAINHKLAKGSKSVIGTVTATKEPTIALDTADARVVHRPNRYLPLTRSEMALPLVLKDQVVGALDVQSNTPNAFSDEDVEVLTTLAAQISVTLDNARLFEQTQNRMRDMSFLFEATSAAAAPDKSLSEALQDVADRVRGALNVLSATLYLIEEYEDPSGEVHQMLRAFALSGSDQPLSELSEIQLDSSVNVLSRVVKEQQPRLIDVARERGYMAIHPDAVAAAAAPLTSGAQAVGVVVVEDSRLNAFSEDTTRLLMTLTNSLSAIVQSAHLLEQMQKQNLQLRELDRLKSDFLANMSHELRTPLNSIIGFSRIILKGVDGPLTEMQEQDLSTIHTSGTHLLGLINDILDQAKISSGKMSVHSEYFEIKPVVEGVRSIGIGLVKDKSVEIKLEVSSGLPPCYGDEMRVRQVLLNLVSNASKFTQQGSVTIRAYQERNPESGVVMMRVDVQDTGIGIAEKDIPLLFEAFRQVDSSLTRTVGGTGLGLPIAKSLIEMQGGQMLVHSMVNVGSTFSITIPLKPPVPMESEDDDFPSINDSRKTMEIRKPVTGVLNMPSFDPAPVPPPILSAPPEPLPTKRTLSMPTMPPVTLKRQILLIEDAPDRVDIIRRALQREGFDIFSASIPLEAEAMAGGLRPTLIIMSAEFSGGSGWDILARMREREDTRDIPVIVVGLNDEAQRAAAVGAFAYLQRPFMPEQIQDLVRRAEADSRTERILIIDDQPESTRLIHNMLDQVGHFRVFAAHSGIEGMSLVARRRPDLVILDLRMPDMDGFAVLSELRANPETARIPVLVVTADALNEDEQRRLSKLSVIDKNDLQQGQPDQFFTRLREHLTTLGQG